jgi:hypothetical protein
METLVILRQSCPLFPVLAVLSVLSSLVVQSGCPVLYVLNQLSCRSCPVLAVLTQHSCLTHLSRCPDIALWHWPTCPSG